MIINQNSWHFKLIHFFWDRKTTDLCTYMRRLVIALVMSIVGISFGASFLSLFGGAFFAMIGQSVMIEEFNNFVQFLLSFLVGIPVLMFVLGFIYVVLEVIPEIYKDLTKRKPDYDKKPSLVKTWYKSKQGKYCSSITYK